MLNFKYYNFCKFVLAILNQYVNMHSKTVCNHIKVRVRMKHMDQMDFPNKQSLLYEECFYQHKISLLSFALIDVQSTITSY